MHLKTLLKHIIMIKHEIFLFESFLPTYILIQTARQLQITFYLELFYISLIIIMTLLKK